jgi:hypothetical protein
MEARKNACRILVGKSEGKSRWVDNIKLDLGERVWGGMDCMGGGIDRWIPPH